jgi:riboflavin synthase
MFTGIVECTAKVLDQTASGILLKRPEKFDDLVIGASVSVLGVCLSVVHLTDDEMGFDVIAETWARTNLSDRKPGQWVNVERSVRADGRFEGHIVQGHIEGTGEITSIGEEGKWTMLRFKVSEELLPFIVHKGGIAVDGVSLTVAGLRGHEVAIALIPHTMKMTTFAGNEPGDRVNIETDVVGRYVHSFLHRDATSPYLPPDYA